MAANLRYTTADVDFWESHLQDEAYYDRSPTERHLRLSNPRRADVLAALREAIAWLRSYKDDPEWDGGALMFCFAGHGREGDGAAYCEDGMLLTPDEFTETLAQEAALTNRTGRLRVSAVLDSCHSGAFTTRLLDACWRDHRRFLIPFHVFAACMHDEFAREDCTLGHGIFTYCFSVRHSLRGYAAQAVQPDNSFGPSLALAAGELGCSLMTGGAQNPVAYFNGSGHLEVGEQEVDLFDGDRLRDLQEVRERLEMMRTTFAGGVRAMRPRLRVGPISSDAEMREVFQEQRRSIAELTAVSERLS
jgi:hypothetical protein